MQGRQETGSAEAPSGIVPGGVGGRITEGARWLEGRGGGVTPKEVRTQVPQALRSPGSLRVFVIIHRASVSLECLALTGR